MVNRLGGAQVTKEELGGWEIQCKDDRDHQERLRVALKAVESIIFGHKCVDIRLQFRKSSLQFIEVVAEQQLTRAQSVYQR